MTFAVRTDFLILISLLAIGIVIAAVGGLLASRVTAGLTEYADAGPGRQARYWTVRFAAVVPFMCLMWVAFVTPIFFNSKHDVPIESYVELPNSYALGVSTNDGTGYLMTRYPIVPAIYAHTLDMPKPFQSVQISGETILGFVHNPFHLAKPLPPEQATTYYFIFDTTVCSS